MRYKYGIPPSDMWLMYLAVQGVLIRLLQFLLAFHSLFFLLLLLLLIRVILLQLLRLSRLGHLLLSQLPLPLCVSILLFLWQRVLRQGGVRLDLRLRMGLLLLLVQLRQNVDVNTEFLLGESREKKNPDHITLDAVSRSSPFTTGTSFGCPRTKVVWDLGSGCCSTEFCSGCLKFGALFRVSFSSLYSLTCTYNTKHKTTGGQMNENARFKFQE